MASPAPFPDHNSAPQSQQPQVGVWVRWLVGILILITTASLGFAAGVTRTDASQTERLNQNDLAIKELKAKQGQLEEKLDRFATKEDLKSVHDDVTYIRGRLDDMWGPPSQPTRHRPRP